MRFHDRDLKIPEFSCVPDAATDMVLLLRLNASTSELTPCMSLSRLPAASDPIASVVSPGGILIITELIAHCFSGGMQAARDVRRSALSLPAPPAGAVYL